MIFEKFGKIRIVTILWISSFEVWIIDYEYLKKSCYDFNKTFKTSFLIRRSSIDSKRYSNPYNE